MTHHTVYKTVEAETDREGVFFLPGAYMPFVDSPRMIIYSKGYLPWRNDSDFETKTDYKEVIWKNRETYKLKRLDPCYSKQHLDSFVSGGFLMINSKDTPRFNEVQVEVGREAIDEINHEKKFRDGGGE